MEKAVASGAIKTEGKQASKNVKKEEAKKEPAKEEPKKVEITKIEQADLAINAWGDLFFSKAGKEIAKNPDFQLKTESNIFFAVDAVKKEISFKGMTETDKVDEKSFVCFYKARCANRFYFKKDAQAKLKTIFGKEAQELKFRVEFSKDKSGKLFLQ